MNALLVASRICVTLSALILSTGLVQADGIKARGGTLACGGNHFSRLAGSEVHRTSYIFRNFNANATITIESVQVFDANGNLLFDFPGIGLPPQVKNELGPNETTQINTADILLEDLDSADRPIQTHVGWSSGRSHRYIPLNGSTVRTVRVAGTGAELSRTSSECNLIDYRQQ